MVIPIDQAKLYTFPQECPAYRRNASMKFRKSRPSIAASIGRMIALSIPRRPDASPERKMVAASTHSSAVTPTSHSLPRLILNSPTLSSPDSAESRPDFPAGRPDGCRRRANSGRQARQAADSHPPRRCGEAPGCLSRSPRPHGAGRGEAPALALRGARVSGDAARLSTAAQGKPVCRGLRKAVTRLLGCRCVRGQDRR